MGMKLKHFMNARRIVAASQEPSYDAKIFINSAVRTAQILTAPVDIVPDSLRKHDVCGYYITPHSAELVLDYIRDQREDMRHVGILNFASYTIAGGGFLNGCMAQEENLCHKSLLYPVLEKMNDQFYAWNRKDINNHIYHNRCLYTESIPFFVNVDETVEYLSEEDTDLVSLLYANVLTIAAPVNSEVLNKLCPGREKEVHEALKERIDLMFSSFMMTGNDILILGPFGCGIFNNDPYRVAKIMIDLLSTKYDGVFKEIYFAIPHEDSFNYRAFTNQLEKFFEEVKSQGMEAE